MQLPHIRRIIGGIGMGVAVVVAVSIPAGYFGVRWSAGLEELEFKARLSAGKAAQYIFTHERLWQYQQVRLAELVQFPRDGEGWVRQRITDLRGRVIVQEEGSLPGPLQHVRVPVLVSGEPVAWLDAETTARPLVRRTGVVAAGSLLLGLVAWLSMRLLPLRVLDETLRRLSTESRRFQAALDNMSQGLCMFDAGNRLVVHNRRFAEMFGPPAPGAAAATLPATGALPAGAPSDAAWQEGQRDSVHEMADGRVIQVSRQAIPGGGWVATYEDISERRRSQERLSHMARHDALTGLPNRVLFREHMDRVLPHLRRGERLAVLCLDLDRFKAVNDTLGHSGGDELLRLVGHRLREHTRETDLVARLGGDEFAVIHVGPEQPDTAAILAERLVVAIREPFAIMGQRVEIGTSIGIVLADEVVRTPDEMLRTADIALYHAKAAGRGDWRRFEPGMDAEIHQRRTMEADLRGAVALKQFEVHYQPLIDARSRVLTGFEALVRWRHPERGLLPPADFLPLAEELGVIRAIGAWVLERACADAARWPEHVKIAVNLSAVQFANGTLVEEVAHALAAAGLAPARLELEITESVLLQDNAATLRILHRLHDLGVRISMDDFGTGYSSLSYLRRFPFDKIKIDQSFIQSLVRETGSIEIVRAVVGLGKALGMEVLAEGVETAEQLDILQGEGCDELQGYLFSKPLPVEEMARLIAQFSVARA